MEPTTVTEMRLRLASISQLATRLLDMVDETHRELSAIEDSQAAYQSSVRRLRSHLDAS